MNKNLKSTMVVVSILFLVFVSIIGINNSLVSKEEEVNGTYANISVQLERRADLIPNLITIVKEYMSHEKEIIDKVTSSREKLVNANSVSEQAEANKELSNTLADLYVVVENYPELKADTQFTQLQDELAGTENRIAVARSDYNNAVKEYNKSIKKFPNSIIASIFNFEAKEYFEAKESAHEVPEVSFE